MQAAPTPTSSPTPALSATTNAGAEGGVVRIYSTASTIPRLSTLAVLLVLVVVCALTKELLVPVALAAFIAILLQPLVTRFQRWGVNRAVAVVMLCVVGTAPVAGVGWVVARQFIGVATMLPQWRGNIQHKLDSLQGPLGRINGGISAAVEQLRSVTPAGDQAGGSAPQSVMLVQPPPSAISMFTEFAGPVARPIAVLGIVFVFVVFVLLQWDDLRDRLIRLVSFGKLTATTTALDEMASRIGKFLRTQFLINTGVGIAVGTALSIIGVPSAFLWGFLAAVLRYVPYLGGMVAAALPLFLTIASTDGWAKPLEVLAFFVVLEVVVANIVEPIMFGSTTGISAIALLVAAIFWGWLWGLPGLFLSTPLTVCLVVAGRHIPQLTFLSVLLGDQPSLEPVQKLYQRLLAMDAEDAGEVSDAYLANHTLAQLYDDLFIPTLATADREREEGALDADHQQFIYQAMRDLIEDGAIRAGRIATEKSPVNNGVAVPDTKPGLAGRTEPVATAAEADWLRVLCVPAKSEADALVGLMIEQLASSIEATARALTMDDMGTDLALIVEEFKPSVLIVSSVPPHASMHARARVTQIQRRAPGVRILAGLWGLGLGGQRARERLLASGVHGVVASMDEVTKAIGAMKRRTMADG